MSTLRTNPIINLVGLNLDPILLASSQFSHLITLFERPKDNKNNLQVHINIQGCLYIQKAMFSKDYAFCVFLSLLFLTMFTPSHKNAPSTSTISTTQNRLERIIIDLNKNSIVRSMIYEIIQKSRFPN